MCVQVIGGGVVGLAVARRLAERAGGETLLIERHGDVGRESSSRNSEVSFPLWGELGGRLGGQGRGMRANLGAGHTRGAVLWEG